MCECVRFFLVVIIVAVFYLFSTFYYNLCVRACVRVYGFYIRFNIFNVTQNPIYTSSSFLINISLNHTNTGSESHSNGFQFLLLSVHLFDIAISASCELRNRKFASRLWCQLIYTYCELLVFELSSKQFLLSLLYALHFVFHLFKYECVWMWLISAWFLLLSININTVKNNTKIPKILFSVAALNIQTIYTPYTYTYTCTHAHIYMIWIDFNRWTLLFSLETDGIVPNTNYFDSNFNHRIANSIKKYVQCSTKVVAAAVAVRCWCCCYSYVLIKHILSVCVFWIFHQNHTLTTKGGKKIVKKSKRMKKNCAVCSRYI